MSEHEKSMGLLPIMNPLFNLREVSKQMTLLEDHLNNPRKRCPDCICKHFLTIEALFEEAVSLDSEFKYSKFLDGKAQEIRDLQGLWLDFKDTDVADKGYLMLAQSLRAMRKVFSPFSFDVRKMASTCPHKRYATLSETEKEDREIESLIKVSPKKKPPRKDKMRRRVEIEDKDLDNDKDTKLDPDMKKSGSMASRIAHRYLSNRGV